MSAHDSREEPRNTLGVVGEFGVIDQLQEIAAQAATDLDLPALVVGTGDDAAVIPSRNTPWAISVDMFVEDRHFRTDWSSAIDIGRRCAAAAMADICAMGTTPTDLVVGLAFPPDTSMSFVRELFTGLTTEAAIAGARVVGGDLSASDKIVVSVTALGSAPKKGLLTRSGAQAGDVVAVCGVMGRAAAGLRVLQRGLRSPRILVDAFRYPTIDYTAGVRARDAGARAMADISDGLIADLRHIAQSSNVGVNIDSVALEVTDDLVSAGSAFGLDPVEWVTTGGDDHALVATFPADATLPAGFRPIGMVMKLGPDEHPVVTVDGIGVDGSGGFTHFPGA